MKKKIILSLTAILLIVAAVFSCMFLSYTRKKKELTKQADNLSQLYVTRINIVPELIKFTEENVPYSDFLVSELISTIESFRSADNFDKEVHLNIELEHQVDKFISSISISPEVRDNEELKKIQKRLEDKQKEIDDVENKYSLAAERYDKTVLVKFFKKENQNGPIKRTEKIKNKYESAIKSVETTTNIAETAVGGNEK